MKRRDFVKLTATAAGAMALPRGLRSQPDDPPNVALIIIDDMNDWVGHLGGHPDTITPNLDGLAAQSLMFDNAHCSAPQCVPSRTSFLTSKRPSTTGVYKNEDTFWPDAIEGLPKLQAWFRSEGGYYSLGSGKVFHGNQPDDCFDLHRGHRADPRIVRRPNSGMPRPLSDGLDWYPLDVDVEDMFDYDQIEWVGDQLGSVPDQPVFLSMNLFRPHLPWAVPREIYEKFDPATITPPPYLEGDVDDLPQAARDLILDWRDAMIENYHQRRHAIAAYLASIHFCDLMLGKLLNDLGDFLLAPNTILLVTSDHGQHLGEKEHWLKGTLWARSTRVPFVLRAPGIAAHGQSCHRPVNLIDIFPTFTSLAGLPTAPGMEGVNLRPWIEDPTLPKEEPSVATFGQGNHCAVTEQWRYIRYADLSEELYDHQADPNEWTNLAGDDQYRDLMDDLATWLPDD